MNCFWVINNSQQVLSRLANINQTNRAFHFDSFDFTTLYTNIPHNSLKYNLQALIGEAFKVRGNKYLTITNGVAYWTHCSSCNSYTQEQLVEMLEFLVDNIFVVVGNEMFRQCIGIPMGTDCAPLVANLFLFYYEYKYLKQLMKDNHQRAIMFNNTVRYIDDLLSLNNPGFAEAIPNIYPPELILKKTTESPVLVSYLDVSISIFSYKFCTSVFDKRDTFNFHIVNFPFLDSNIPTQPACGVYISQIIRISRICDEYHKFVERHYLITSRLLQQGFKYSKLCKAFKVFSGRHVDLFCK